MNGSRFTLAAVGDISFNGQYDDPAAMERARDIFTDVAAELRADLLVGNLEAVLISPRPSSPPWRFCMRGAPRYADILKNAGFQVLTMASNHIMDYGWQGVQETLDVLHPLGFLTPGVGRNLREARLPASLNIGGLQIAVLAYCSIHVGIPLYATESEPGVAYADLDQMLTDIKQARTTHDVVIVSIHWGDEYVAYPKPNQREIARALTNAGATLILGHHPHVLQGIERFGEHAVAYSLGNFVFSNEIWHGVSRAGEPFAWNFELTNDARQSAILQATLSKDMVGELRFASVQLGAALLLKASGEATAVIRRRSRYLLSAWLYRLIWVGTFLPSRLFSQYRQNFRGRRLSRIRPRHILEIGKAIAHELQQLRGAKQ